MKRVNIFIAGLILVLSQSFLTANAGWDPDDKDKPTSTEEVDATIAAFLKQDANIQSFLIMRMAMQCSPRFTKRR